MDVDGFTLITDGKMRSGGEEYSGIRLVWTPEISARFADEATLESMLDPDQFAAMYAAEETKIDDIVNKFSENDDILFAKSYYYDTHVMGEENYRDFIDDSTTTGTTASQGTGTVSFGKPLLENVRKAVERIRKGRAAGPISDGSTGDASGNQRLLNELSEVTPSLSMDEVSRMGRAAELGFDVNEPRFHGSPEKNIEAFDLDRAGTQTDAGFYGKGIYFADNPGEAGYYAPNVETYLTRGNLLDLEDLNVSLDDQYLGSPVQFKAWAEKLDSIGLLDDYHKQGLETMKRLDAYVDKNITIGPARNADGSEGFHASIIDPNSEPYSFQGKLEYRTIDSPTDARGNFPKTKEDAIRRAKRNFIRDQKFRENSPFKGLDDLAVSLSDYLRLYEGGPSAISEKAKQAGFDGIKIGGETVIFDPKNIRKKDAKFDPANIDSDNLLSLIVNQMLPRQQVV